ncbi:hypothetical protein AVEN_154935-1 [Araneus ventricosus]|uniref:Uncharacterized protein n=1 Tax=Araneus ventricosus TaxID=182803 RepID=A0A4Y2A8F9_ARAVE|nr:hypothetical protein AVEN_154935-1 [Araneus ventricosus]
MGNIIWSDESSFTIFQTNSRVYVWRTPAESHRVDYHRPSIKYRGDSLMLWGMMSHHSLGSLVILLAGCSNHKGALPVLRKHVESLNNQRGASKAVGNAGRSPSSYHRPRPNPYLSRYAPMPNPHHYYTPRGSETPLTYQAASDPSTRGAPTG